MNTGHSNATPSPPRDGAEAVVAPRGLSPTDQARLLLAILREDWDEAGGLARRGRVDPAGFEALCQTADVPTWVHERLRATGHEGLVGDEAFGRLGRIRSRIQRDNLLLLAETERALDLLLAAGVVPVALKGLDLLHRVYDGFDVRTLDDVDLLLAPEQLPAALDALQQAGWQVPPEPKRTHYIRSSHHLPLDSPGPIPVGFELHWNLAQETRYDLDGAALLRRARPLEIAGRALLRLDDHDVVAHLILHHFTHYFDRRLKWAVDLHRVAAGPGFRWEIVIERLREWGASASAAVSLQHLAKQFPGWIPEDVLRAFPVAAWRRFLGLPLRTSHPLDLYRGTRRRSVQLYLAAIHLERPWRLPGWLLHRALRDRRRSANPLEEDGDTR